MVLVLPLQSDEKSRAELAAIRAAGKRIAASPELRREFLTALGFGKKPKKVAAARAAVKSVKQKA